jgi:hypothetical protein
MEKYSFVEPCDTQKLSYAITKALGKWIGSVSSDLGGTTVIFHDRQLSGDEQKVLSELVKQNPASEQLKEQWAKPLPALRCKRRAALYFFECTETEIVLEPGLVMRVATESEKSRWGDKRCYNHVLEYVFDYEHEDKNLMNLVILALLLFKPGKIRMEWKASGIINDEVDTSPMVFPDSLPFEYDAKYVLDSEEVGRFVDFWKELRATEIPRPVLLASRKLVQSNSSKDFEERIVYCITALECLVIGGKDESSKRWNLSDRVVLLVAGSPTWEKEIKRQLDLAYDIRNDIVHDGEPSAEHRGQLRFFPHMFCDSLEDHIRRTIRAYLLLIRNGFCKDKKELIDRLSVRILPPDIQQELKQRLKQIRRI